MIEINLLPEELQKKKRFSFNLNLEPSKLMVYGGGGIAGLLVLLVLLLFLGSFIRGIQISGLDKKEKAFAPKMAEIELVNKEITDVKTKMGALNGVTVRKFLWAEKLNQLSDLVPPGAWFTRVRTDPENRFIIEGSVVSRGEEEMASVGKFMKNLKDDQKFFRDFTNIKLESVQRKNKDGVDMLDFKIALYF
ncbi:MAG: PilN domain-containing protein [Candidatus Omnitrophota bacterium]